MDIRNDIKYYMAREAVTFKQLAAMMSEKTGKKYTINTLSGKLIRESITLKETLQILELLGYNIKIEKN
ncbi:hypothetical protein KID03_01440 [bacterium]|nr:hypothetical protein [bacterium]PWL76922.1 MAG: hypothetical protein DBY21_06240 [Candidatus Gastranaerophilales bacterium]PWL80390.1 MAG: hypothetical protein DBY21_01870 [Candidatus Gastranaerophilales bacterium]